MKKMYKKIISLVLAVILCISLSISVFATSEQFFLVNETVGIVNSLMTEIEPNKAMYGLENVNFASGFGAYE